jgi:hypothetical protein
MTANVGRTAGKYVKFQIADHDNTLRDIAVNTFGNVGLTFAEVDVTALQDAITSVLNGQSSFSTTISGPFDTTVEIGASTTGLAAALSGSHPVLSQLNGVVTPRSFGIYIGIQRYWTTNDPVFGGSACAIITQYTVDPAAGTYTAKLSIAGNRSADPAWGTAQISAA